MSAASDSLSVLYSVWAHKTEHNQSLNPTAILKYMDEELYILGGTKQ